MKDVKIPNSDYYKHLPTRICYYISVSPIFNGMIMVIIMVNTVMLASEKYPSMPKTQETVFSYINYGFTAIFLIEIMIKVMGLRVSHFIKDKFNIFDSMVVVLSVVEIVLDQGGSGSLSALRAFRLFRILKLLRFGDLRVILESITLTVGAIGNYVVLLFLFIYIYSMVGMQYFAGKIKLNDENQVDMINGKSPRMNFDTLVDSFITIFVVLIGDNWNTIMYDCIRCVGYLSCFYFIGLILMGNIIMLNLFLAILLGNFHIAR